MLGFLVTVLISYIAWLAFTFSFVAGNLIAGAIVSLCVAFISSRFLFHKKPSEVFNPVRWGYFIGYLFILLYCEIKSHFDVAYRIITGRINPAIIKVTPHMRTDLGKTLLGSSITLTPGTLVVGAERELYMHTLYYEKGHETGETFGKISRKVVGE